MSYQFDLSQQPYRTSKLPIIDSTKGGFPAYYINGGLQVGIDGRLYGATADFGRLAVIDYPNQAGLACNPHYVYYDFNGSKPGIGLPNFIQSIFNSDTTSINLPDTPCGDQLIIWPNPVLNDVLHVDLGNPTCLTGALKIYDVSGRLVADFPNLITSTFDINVAAWSGGMYLFEFQFSNKRITKKVVRR
ncbi:T9SS type A sorting domain-containing protein [Spirosoma endophyticum]|uniref:Por secretion system C-terminal sorting domain-containing protein n=1 Tax=Spirosoma endophyticum TaxID=662367 RepID=A0A1I2I9C5_9BACT|nr:T9SS type A sorting domain-containing protein [Spirosoma endophyticum]SFF38200.1 Por secretion system C-terminal sorting domain-containing protein [Spirosoma endophyticum]